jgi:3-hydroxybutyryl-CoA dehydrogenase
MGEGPQGHDDVAVIGGGTMGAGIVQVALCTAGVEKVHLVEGSADAVELAVTRIREGLGKQHRKAEEANQLVEAAMARLTTQVGMSALASVSLVVEAVPEDLALKSRILSEASQHCPQALIASNTSSLSVSGLSQSLAPGTSFIGMHFFNPVPRSKLVEIVKPDNCDPATVDLARSWVERLGKQSIEVGDSPGFATSRLGVAIALEAMRMLESGVASAHDIDRGMVLGYQFPLGPLELTDMIGLDVRLAISEHLAIELGSRFEPPEILRTLVASGHLGQKTGRGFYDWSKRS